MPYQLAYSSRATAPQSVESMQALLEQSRAYNHANGITGLLLYSDPLFFQILEGEEQEVRRVLARIARDPRNYRLRVLAEGLAEERLFSDWAMSFTGVVPPDLEALANYTDTRAFRFLQPRAYGLGPELLELVQTVVGEYPMWPHFF